MGPPSVLLLHSASEKRFLVCGDRSDTSQMLVARCSAGPGGATSDQQKEEKYRCEGPGLRHRIHLSFIRVTWWWGSGRRPEGTRPPRDQDLPARLGGFA